MKYFVISSTNNPFFFVFIFHFFFFIVGCFLWNDSILLHYISNKYRIVINLLIFTNAHKWLYMYLYYIVLHVPIVICAGWFFNIIRWRLVDIVKALFKKNIYEKNVFNIFIMVICCTLDTNKFRSKHVLFTWPQMSNKLCITFDQTLCTYVFTMYIAYKYV